MNESKLIETVDALLLFASVSLIYGILYIEPHRAYHKEYPDAKYELIPFEEEPSGAIYNPYIAEELKLRNEWQDISITYTTIETEYAGRHFITAYCPEECGWSWSTSSGAICHYSDNPLEPTTCAIDRRYHAYSEYLMIDGKIYVTEDTGPGVRGFWVDCFVETMEEVRTFNTRYADVYYVTFITHRKDGTEHYERVRNYLCDRCIGGWTDYRNDYRTDD